MYIKAMINLEGEQGEENHGLMSFCILIMPALSIFEYLEEVEEFLEDSEWQLMTLDEIEFGVDKQRFLDQNFTFYTYSQN